MKKIKIPRKGESKSRRAIKTWTKGRAFVPHDEEAVPKHTVSMKPRLKTIQYKEEIDPAAHRGRIIASSGRGWMVEKIDFNGEQEHTEVPQFYECVPLRSIVTQNPNSTLIAVGDYVLFKPTEDEVLENDNAPDQGVILLVEERQTKLAREAAGKKGSEQVIVSNLEQLVIVMAAADPFYNRRLVDRYLIEGELGGLSSIICINKIDLMDENFIREDMQVYEEELGVPVFLVSAKNNNDLDALAAALAHKSSVLSGPSGVGKSTLLNYLIGDEIQATGEFSKKYQTGVHTTSFTRLFRLHEGGYIADTPGIREFGIRNVDPEYLSFYFHDFDDFRDGCRFTPCTHTHEPGCAVKEAVEEGYIDPQRYESYCKIFESM